jgi:Protein of unknown function (DUF3767)
MAGDTRESSSPDPHNPVSGKTKSPGLSRTAQKNYEVFDSPPVSANALPPGSGLNTAGSKINSNPTLFDAIKTVRLEDFKQVHMYPCVRDSLLTGIGAGFGIGGLRGIFGGELPTLAFSQYPALLSYLIKHGGHFQLTSMSQLQFQRQQTGPWARSCCSHSPTTSTACIGVRWRRMA